MAGSARDHPTVPPYRENCGRDEIFVVEDASICVDGDHVIFRAASTVERILWFLHFPLRPRVWDLQHLHGKSPESHGSRLDVARVPERDLFRGHAPRHWSSRRVCRSHLRRGERPSSLRRVG